MSDQIRRWKLATSIKLALVIGGFTGIVMVGLTYLKFVGDLEPYQSLLVGAGIMVGLTLLLTYLFDQISKSAQSFVSAVKGKGRADKK
jgi:hypothetical protein